VHHWEKYKIDWEWVQSQKIESETEFISDH